MVLLDQGSSKTAMMELCRRYSNRPNLLNPLFSALDKIKKDTPGTEPDLVPVRGKEAGVWRITDRLSLSDVDTLIKSYRAGSTARLLAERYSVSTATAKRPCFVNMVCAGSVHDVWHDVKKISGKPSLVGRHTDVT